MQENNDRKSLLNIGLRILQKVYDAVKKGVKLELPKNIADGLTDVSKRTEWNNPADSDYALPTEIWRETVARRQRYEDIKFKIASGEIQSINDLITYNLNIRQFAQDIIENCEGLELLRAIWRAIVGRIPEKSNEKFQQGISILDPTCGSGAFLFAALNILEPLYEACLDRMQAFVDELENNSQKETEKYSDFKTILSEVQQHHNEKYFIYKSIIINNLFGVDIMEEAVEICKLRLFLKLVAQVEKAENIEPLPDIDFNIRAGNTLVGFATLSEVKNALKGDLIEQMALPEIEEEAQNVDMAYQIFRQMQTKKGMDSVDFSKSKEDLNQKLAKLESRLNGYLVGVYGIKEKTNSFKAKFENWLKSHQPFHWCIDFYGIINNGGFDVIIGNPPYVEYSKIKKEYHLPKDIYKTETCGNLYAFVIERSFNLSIKNGYSGLIVPLSSFSTQRMTPLQELYEKNNSLVYLSNYEATSNPTTLFVGVKIQLAIILTSKTNNEDSKFYTTNYLRSFSGERPILFSKIFYTRKRIIDGKYCKIYSEHENSILDKMYSYSNEFGVGSNFFAKGNFKLYYRSMGNFFFKLAFSKEPIYLKNGKQEKSSTVNELSIKYEHHKNALISIINTTLFYYYWVLMSDCYHLSASEIKAFPVLIDKFSKIELDQLVNAGKEYLKHLEANATWQIENKKDGTVKKYRRYFPQPCKQYMDKIDKILAKYYGFTDEELDFIINYDIKYRMGSELNDEDD